MIDTCTKKLDKQCQWYDILETEGQSTPIVFKNNRIHSINEKQNNGYGIRVNVNGNTGFSYTNNSRKLIDTADRALEISVLGEKEDFSLPEKTETSFHPYDERINTFKTEDEIAKAEEAIEEILSAYPDSTIDLTINKSTGTTRLRNSEGIDSNYKNSYYSASISVTHILQDGSKVDIWDSISARSPKDFLPLTDRITDKLKLAEQESKTTSAALPILFYPRAFASILGIVASGLNSKSVWKGISPFTGKMGEQMFNDALTLHNDPLLGESPFSYPWDDEGVIAKRSTLINRGTISAYISDLKHAHLLSLDPGGNASRGYASLPAPSFSNITIDKGNESYKDIIKSISRGILVDQFIGLGQSNTLSGEFSANLDLAFLIKDGEITGRVKDCMISGNIFDLLAGDISLSSEQEQSGATLAPYLLLPAVNYTC